MSMFIQTDALLLDILYIYTKSVKKNISFNLSFHLCMYSVSQRQSLNTPTTVNVIVQLPEPFLFLFFAENTITENIYLNMFEMFAFPTEHRK
jgi:hypothetical protein